MKATTLRRLSAFVAAGLLLGPFWMSAWAASPPELCDGRDNDADGSLDEGCLRTCGDRRMTVLAAVATQNSNALTGFGRDRAVAWDGARLAVVWMEHDTDGGAQDPAVYLRRYDSAAQPLEAPIEVAPLVDASGLSGPTVTSSPGGYGVAWDAAPGNEQVHFAFVDGAGNLDAGPVVVSGAGFRDDDPAIAWDGSAFVVAWVRGRDHVYMARVAPDGSVLVPETCVSCSVSAGAAEVSLALRGEEIGYAWAAGDGTGTIRFARSALDGSLLGSVVDLSSGNGGDDPSLVATAAGWAVAWSERPGILGSTEIRFQRLNAAGTPLDTASRLDDGVTTYAIDPAVVWTGEEYLVTWVAYWPGGGFGDQWQLAARQADDQGVAQGAVSLHQEDVIYDFARVSTVWTGSYLGVVWRFQVGDIGPLQSFVRIGGLRCCADGDGDGVSWCDGDADDGDATVFPDATEACDGRDNDLDGSLDEGCERSCEAAPVAAMEDFGTQQDSGVALATGGDEVFLVHADPAAPGVQLVVERGDAPWSTERVEEDEAISTQPAATWTGTRIAAVFRDAREADPRLRVTLRDGLGAAPVYDEPVAPAAFGTEAPVLAWDGLGLALGWREGADASLAFTRLLDSGNRLLDGLILASGVGSEVPELALAPEGDGGVALALLEPAAGGLG
ncbi:MAG: putative metal-binding motif-containing protein [Acidobacteriota bacterium]|nr:putative metal-binding motif-containing protein [Acidobacteriota bacterium]